jgi:hypothetical protein
MFVLCKRRAAARCRAVPVSDALSLVAARLGAFVSAIFLMSGCSPSTQGAPRCAVILPGDLVITEVFADPVGPDGGREWFEIYNAAEVPVELQGVTASSSRADGSRRKTHALRGDTVAAHGFYVLGNAAPDLLPPYLHYGYGEALGELPNGDGGQLSLWCEGTELDAASYDRVRAGVSRAFDGEVAPDYVANDDRERWCDSSERAFEMGALGTPGERNSGCASLAAGRCDDHGVLREPVPPEPGDLIITELMPNPSKVPDATGEWIEVAARRDVDLHGLTVDRLGDSVKPALLAVPGCGRVLAGALAVLARSSDPGANGELPRVDATFALSLVSGAPGAPGDVQLIAGTTVIDSVRWTHSQAGKALQLDSGFVDATANDDERLFCDATAPYGAGDLGTPGAENTRCPLAPPAGMCDERGTLRAIRRPAAGQLVITEYMANPFGVDAEREWFEVTNLGPDSFDLNELLVDRVADTVAPRPIAAAACKPVSAGAFAVIARSEDPQRNGGLPPVDATFSLSLPAAGELRILDGARVLDSISWSSAPASASAQLDWRATSASANDDAANLCPAVSTYGDGNNRGTPGARNGGCP